MQMHQALAHEQTRKEPTTNMAKQKSLQVRSKTGDDDDRCVSCPILVYAFRTSIHAVCNANTTDTHGPTRELQNQYMFVPLRSGVQTILHAYEEYTHSSDACVVATTSTAPHQPTLTWHPVRTQQTPNSSPQIITTLVLTREAGREKIRSPNTKRSVLAVVVPQQSSRHSHNSFYSVFLVCNPKCTAYNTTDNLAHSSRLCCHHLSHIHTHTLLS